LSSALSSVGLWRGHRKGRPVRGLGYTRMGNCPTGEPPTGSFSPGGWRYSAPTQLPQPPFRCWCSASVWSAGYWYWGVSSRGVRKSPFGSPEPVSAFAMGFSRHVSSSDQRSFKNLISPGRCNSSKAPRAFFNNLFWASGWFFLPVVWPSGKSRKAARGGATERVIDRALVMQSVGIPAASSSRAISPTD